MAQPVARDLTRSRLMSQGEEPPSQPMSWGRVQMGEERQDQAVSSPIPDYPFRVMLRADSSDFGPIGGDSLVIELVLEAHDAEQAVIKAVLAAEDLVGDFGWMMVGIQPLASVLPEHRHEPAREHMHQPARPDSAEEW